MRRHYTYSNIIIKHFKHPKNVGKIKKADCVGRAGNLLCGDVMELYLKIRKNKIIDVKFRTLGCIVAIANTSLLTTMVKGKPLDEALKISKDKILKKLGQPLPPIKIHCSILAVDALHEAIYDYYLKNNTPIPKELQKDHERIRHTIEEIEHRHHDFIKMEEDLLNR